MSTLKNYTCHDPSFENDVSLVIIKITTLYIYIYKYLHKVLHIFVKKIQKEVHKYEWQ